MSFKETLEKKTAEIGELIKAYLPEETGFQSAVMDAMGYRMVIHTDHMERLVQYDKFPELDCFRSLAGPSSMKHRYIVEDATIGDSILMQLAQRLGIATPTVHALVQIAGAVNGEDYFDQGLKLEDLGITGSTPHEINSYLQNGDSQNQTVHY